MDLAWDDVQLFLAVAEGQSLSQAARDLRVGQPTVSRRLADLEYQLGYLLFHRDAAGVRLTTAGERLVAPARKMAEWAAEVARSAAQGDAGGPAGTVRVTAPPGVAFDFLAPFALRVRERYPNVRLEVLGTIYALDLGRGEADLALRLQSVATRDLVVVAELSVQNQVVAARSYTSRLPPRPRPQDIAWIGWAPPFEDVTPNPELRAVIPDFQPVFTSDNYLVQWRACEAGLGAMIRGALPRQLDLPTTVVPIDVDLGPYTHSKLVLLAVRSALAIPRVRAVAEMIAAEFDKAKS